ncbi:MAG TPA: DUF805 domain-containing protein [Burkholderiales bacterium]|jgi:uncharacterized membrane protein YhaH (DUF805 family)
MAQQNVMHNPYGAPRAMVGDAAEQFQPVKLFAVSGRIGRARYVVYSMLVSLLIMTVATMSMAFLGPVGIAVLVVGYIAMFVLQIMLTIQRSHDFNMTGWFALLALVPLVNLLFWFVPGTDGPNQFGAKTPPNSVGVLVCVWIVPVVFVLGIMAAVAIPAYQDYAKRAATVQTR